MAVNFPNMQSEVLEAIHLMYEDNPDIEADCYLYLESLDGSLDRQKAISIAGMKALGSMYRCERCGHILEAVHHKEIHNELEGNPVEITHEYYCPVCDLGKEDDRYL